MYGSECVSKMPFCAPREKKDGKSCSAYKIEIYLPFNFTIPTQVMTLSKIKNLSFVQGENQVKTKILHFVII